jgi:dipeptidyl aminopeptidase/acylaminoacyl peptidase
MLSTIRVARPSLTPLPIMPFPVPFCVVAALRHTLAPAIALMAATASFAGEQPVPISAFFDSPHVSSAKLSPDGKRLAMVVNNESGREQLGVVSLEDQSMKVVGVFSDADVGSFEWVNNGRLLYNSRDKRTAQGDVRHGPGLFAVNVDGSGQRQLSHMDQWLTPPPRARKRLPANTFMLGQPGAQDSDWVYVLNPDLSSDRVDLIKLNTVTGFGQNVDGPGPTRRWWLDAKGQPALAMTVEDRLEVLYYLDPRTGSWRKLGSRPYMTYAEEATASAPAAKSDDHIEKVFVTARATLKFTPLGFTPEGRLYVISHKNRDKDTLFAYDLTTDKLAERPLVDLEQYDFHGSLVTSASKLLGVRYTVDAESTNWFDPAMKQAQEAVDKLLPGRVNALSVGVRSETPFVLVESWSDRQPPVFLLFNRDTGKLSEVGETRPAIRQDRMAEQALEHVTARDGRPIPTWVTMPNQSQGTKLPMVVLVHGGPYMRGHEWGWSSESQFLASRGYAVLEPEFRGSTGFGQAHFRAGWKQWGLGMQDDIADVTQWAIAEGIADPRRICIGGSGYGGYAAMMGMIRDPALYKCGIGWAGVTDIDLLYKGDSSADSDLSDEYKRQGMPSLVGDPVTDAAQFAATSPLKQAARITQPLLLAYGGDDRRVPMYHGAKFYDAIRKTNKNVEWVTYDKEGEGWGLSNGVDGRRMPGYQGGILYDPVRQTNQNVEWVVYGKERMVYDENMDSPGYRSVELMTVYEKEGHGWDLAQTRVDFWGRVEKFLEQNIGAGER